jgi:hypothetical protein
LSSGEALSVQQNLHAPKIDDRMVWGKNLCIVFDDCSPISLIAMDEIKLQFIILIQLLSSILAFHPPNAQIPNCSKEKLFTRYDAGGPGQSGHVGFARQVSAAL